MRRSRAFLTAWLVLLGLTAGCGERAREPLLLLISVDTLRADHVGAFGGPADLTPHLDALVGRSVRFDAAFSTCAYTLPSMGALMTGRYPEEIGLQSNVALLDDESLTLANVLRVQGWRSGAVVSNFVLGRASGMDRGFDRYDVELDVIERNRKMPERIATNTTDAALRTIDELAEATELGPKGVLLWVHYQDPHGPYLPPGDLRQAHLEAARASPLGNPDLRVGNHLGFGKIPDYQLVEDQTEAAFYRAGYLGEVQYTDAEIGRLLEGLGERGWLDDAVIVFTADHGEGLGEAGYWFAHGEYLTDALVRVPLSIAAPGLTPGVRSDAASHVDLLPTLLGLLGQPTLARLPGRDLFDTAAPAAPTELYLATLRGSVVPRFGLVADGYRYTVARPKGRPPKETLHPIDAPGTDLSESDEARLDDMRRRLRRLRGQLRVRAARPRSVSEDERERLRALGYEAAPPGEP